MAIKCIIIEVDKMIKTKCPNCNQPISKKWLSSISNKVYICEKCGIKMEWNKYATLARVIGYMIAAAIIVFTRDLWNIKSTILKVILAGIIVWLTDSISVYVFPNIFFPNTFSVKK